MDINELTVLSTNDVKTESKIEVNKGKKFGV